MISTSPRSGRAEVNLSCVITVVTAALTLLWATGIGVTTVLEMDAVPPRLAVRVLSFGALLAALNGGAALLFLRAARLVTAEGAPGTAGLDHAPVERAAGAARGVLLLGVALTPPMMLAVGLASRALHPASGPAEMAQWFTVMAAVSAAIAVAVAAAEWCAWLFLLAAVAAQVYGNLAPAGAEFSTTVHTSLMTVATCSFIFAAVHHLRLLAQYVDLALLRSAQEVADAAAQSAATSEAARIDGLVHDHVLAALLLASRADDPQDGPFVRRSAAAALAALSDIRAPEGVAGSAEVDGEVSLGDVAGTLAREARAADPSLTLTADGPLDLALPAGVATTMSAAALEAVRNSVRHAGTGLDRPVRRWITLRAQQPTVTISVGDDGAGFDPATAPQGRYGVSGSILGRMDGLDGGAGRIAAAPGQGTLVDLTWTDPRAAAPTTSTDTDIERSTAGAAGKRGDPVSPGMHHLARITRNLEEPMPVGPRVRGGLATGLGLAALGLFSVNDFTPPWPHLLVLATTAAWVVHLLVTWAHSGLADLSTRTALTIGLWAPIAFLVSLVTWHGAANPELWLWTIALACMAPTLLSLANHPVIAWVSSLTSGAFYLAWTLTNQGVAGLATMSWLLVALLPLALNPIQRASFTAMSSAATVATSHRADVDVQARQTAALNARRTRGLRVDSLARPLLERLAAGERTGPAVRIEAAQLEAHLRDDLRARCFRDTEVARAAHDARRAGVRVELMDDGALDHASDRLRAEVIAASVAVLDAAETGAVIIRVAPPDRDLVATIVASPVGADPTRLEIHPDFLPAGAGDGLLPAEVA